MRIPERRNQRRVEITAATLCRDTRAKDKLIQIRNILDSSRFIASEVYEGWNIVCVPAIHDVGADLHELIVGVLRRREVFEIGCYKRVAVGAQPN